MTKCEKLRREAGYTVEQLSEKAKVGGTTIQAIEDGAEPATVKTARKLGAALGVPWAEFYPDATQAH